MFESYYNFAKSMYQVNGILNFKLRKCEYFFFQQGDLQSSFRAIKNSLDIYKNHSDSKQIFDELKKMFSEL